MDGGFRCILYCSIVYVSGIIRDVCSDVTVTE